MIEVKTQAALEKALKAEPGGTFHLIGKVAFVVQLATGAMSPTLIVMPGAKLDASSYGGPRIYIDARGNSTVTARGNSTVTARENSTVTARENSTVTARGYAFVRVFSAKKVDAGEACIVALHTDASSGGALGVGGGRQLICPLPTTPRAWCDHYGVEVKDEIAIVYKAVDDTFRSPRGGDYRPGTIPVCADWDGGRAECGGGYHFSPHPMMAKAFFDGATRFLACPVALTDIAVHPRGNCPEKIKARGCCASPVEVDINGKLLIPALKPQAAE